MSDKLLDVEQTANLLGVPISKVRRMVRFNEIPFIKLGHYVRFRKESLEEWIADLEKNNSKVGV